MKNGYIKSYQELEIISLENLNKKCKDLERKQLKNKSQNMAIFQINSKKSLELVRENDFKLEKEIQKLTEENLKTIFDLEFVKSEFSLNNLRIDTLAFDASSSSFVIIEYKRDKNFSVVDQGLAYLSLMLNRKGDFIVEYNERDKNILKKDSVDWSQSKVIFIAPSFTTFQREAINFKNLPIELWEIRRYQNDLVSYTRIQSATKVQESISTITKESEQIQKIEKEVAIYSEEELVNKGSDQIKELYEKIKNIILSLDDIDIVPKKHYISFKGYRNIFDAIINKNSLIIVLNLSKGELKDEKNLVTDVSKKGHWGSGDYQISLTNDENIDDVIPLLKQTLNKNKK